jgi:hypothetical protein
VAGASLGVGATTLPKSGKCRVWFVPGGVDCGITKPGGDFKEQRGFANLPRPREKLDSAWCGFLEALQEEVPIWSVVTREFRHTRIIIKIYLTRDWRQLLSRPSREIAGWLVGDVVRSPEYFAART